MGLSGAAGPLAAATIRTHPADFLVEELSLFEPSGAGEHVALLIRKSNLDHRSMVRRVANAFGVPPGHIGWAGMKDRVAVTMQWITVHTPQDDAELGDELQIVHSARHARRLRTGQLTGNRFVIRMRGVDPTAVIATNNRLEAIVSTGLPNRFMSQRFGYRGANAVLGTHLLRGEFDQLLRVWLGEEGPPSPDEEQSRRRHFEEGQFNEARAEWPANWRPECDALQQLAEGDNAKRVVHYVPRDIRRIWTDSAQSAIFNDVLDRRLASGTASVVGEDDISWKYDRFYEAIDVPVGEPVPTGPLWGKRMRRATGVIDTCECEALERAGLSMQCFDGRRGPAGARRPLVVPIVSPRCEAGFDEHGPYVEVGFTLPKGAYATAVMDAIMSPDAT
jgi:tRNA pseudouridine13 synthase